MTSVTHDAVCCAVHQLVKAACPYADVLRNADKPARPGPGGTVIVRDGDPGDAEIDLSPPRWNYARSLPLEFSAATPDLLNALACAIGEAIEADRTLGGLCDWLDAEALQLDPLNITGGGSVVGAEAAVVAHYATSNPLK